MNLLVDIGNSRIKWAQQDSSDLVQHRIVARDSMPLADLLDKYWRQLQAPEQTLVASVAGSAVAGELTRWTLATWRNEPRFASVSSSAGGVRNGYRDHRQLGIDRWLAVIAAWRKYCSPACVIDCGTALTIDAVDAAGLHLGGLIMPGQALMRESLGDRAPGIAIVDNTTVFSGLADNTAAAVNGGCLLASVAAIEHVIASLRQQLGADLKCLITGGDALLLLQQIDASHMDTDLCHEPYLVLEGLAAVFQEETA